MFGQSKPVVFERYGRRRSRWLPPRWLVLLLVGTTAGAAGVLFVQERYLPPRLSANAGNDLQKAFAQADADRARLKGELGETSKRLDAALADKKAADEALVASRAAIDRLHADVASAVDSLPPDPRGGTVEVRAAQFTTKGGLFAYDVVLTRSRDTAKPMAGVLQFSVAGESARGGETTAALKPVELSIGSHQVLRGSLPLPEGFRPRQTTIQVLDRVGGKALGMRVMQVEAR